MEEREKIKAKVLVVRTQLILFLKRIQRIGTYYYKKMARVTTDRRKFTVTVVDDFLTPEEAATLLQRYQPLLRESLHKTTTGDAKRSRYRTSHTVRLPPLGDALVLDIQERAVALQQRHEQSQNVLSSSSNMAATTGHQQWPSRTNATDTRERGRHRIDLGHVEDLQLACYREHELYALHRDDNADFAAQRVATVLLYLQAPTEGGSTLFTNRPLEDERHPHNQLQPLTSEADAVELFTRYCAHPEPHHTVIQAVTGRAVVWNSFVEADPDNDEVGVDFVRDSTHGACPVVTGEKCVVQQWMTRRSLSDGGGNPLMNLHVVALFTAGAAVSYYRDDSDDNERNDANVVAAAMRDSSARRGAGGIERLKPRDGTVATVVMEGPYDNLGALRLTGPGGLSTTLESPLSSTLRQEGLTVSFWVRHVQHGTTLMALKCGNRTIVSATHYNDTVQDDPTDPAQGMLIQLHKSSLLGPVSTFEYVLADPEDWIWCSMSYHGWSSTFGVACWSQSGDLLGDSTTVVEAEALVCGNEESEISHAMELVLLSALSLDERDLETAAAAFVIVPNGDVASAAFVQRQTGVQSPPPSHADVSFIVVHDRMLERNEVRDLRRQALRYDVHL